MTTPSPRLDGGHTPGPWDCERDLSHFDTLTTVVGGCSRKGYLSRELIVQVGGYAGPSEAEANARLIAAAPDMLEALVEAKGLADMAIMSDDLDGSPSDDQSPLAALRLKIDAAIARARGKDHA